MNLALVLVASRRQRLRRIMYALRIRRRLKERNFIKSVALIESQEMSPWYTMYKARDAQSFVATVSVTPDAFDYILYYFKHEYVVLSRPGKSGRPPRIPKKHAVLAMLLHFCTAAVEGKTLHELFGLAPSTFCRVLRRAEEALARTLRRVFGFVDGKNLRVQEPSNVDLQNAQFNGWLHCVFVTGVLCYGVDGTLIWGRHNCPGSWNDGEMSRGLQDILADDTKVGPGMKVASDSAFPVGGRCAGRIITPLKEGDLERQPANCRLAMQTMSDCITSLRQAAEWGMGSATKVYRQLLLPLPYNPALRSVRLDSIFRLYNFRVNGRVPHGFMKALCEKYNVTRQAISRIWIQGQRSKHVSGCGNVASRKAGNCGRKAKYTLAQLEASVKAVPPHSKAIRRRSSRLKPTLTEHHKAQRMSFVRGFIKSTRDGGHSWHDMLDRKVMFLTAVARPRYDPAQRKMWDGKVGTWAFVETQQAKRTSKNRVRGTPITVPMTVTKDIYRRHIIEHVIPSIRLKWPGHRGNTIYIQQDNARPHVSIRDPDVVAAGALHGWDIRLDSQPPMSPDFNVLDLVFFNAIQSLQHQKMSRCIEDLVAAVHEAYVEMDWKILDKTFMTLQNVMEEAFKANGDNVYALPHASKDKTRKTSGVIMQPSCHADSLQHQKMSRCIEDLVAAVHEAYVEMDWKILDKTFMTLQNVMEEAFKANGDNVYALPHASKDKTRKTSGVIMQPSCHADVCAAIDAMQRRFDYEDRIESLVDSFDSSLSMAPSNLDEICEMVGNLKC
ncbi:hypothetical protein H257_11652 [Aphanomyces astaci]|uniref:DDE Tnp4 domain-containing protein n=1 Tax=Aphanomyces astaci TaxID=112090 RepID=W4G1E2_APHAT|nr:hypothetical protein H257_11652 [Aphanomyces astaci]ETV73527.1 hypothetical protein H257_11652 [Aphanomyces astaci]|eukprot:XP_009836953.1 hypothetical protein H257_11652 [Aphanomyces astaci]